MPKSSSLREKLPLSKLRKLRTGAAAVADAYDRYAFGYDFVFGALLQDGRVKTVRAMNIQPGQRVAELGVGSGLMLPLYPPQTPVVAIDISPDMLARAKAKVAALNMPHVELKLADAEHTGLPAGAFDHVVLPYIYSVTPNPEALMRECFRICKPGGSIWILNHFSGLGLMDRLNWIIKPVANALRFSAEFSYQKYVAQYVTTHGWDVVQVQKANLFGLSRVVQARKPKA